MKTAKVTKFEITATKNSDCWTVEVQLPAIVGYENEFRFREIAPSITEALEKLAPMIEGAECYFANDGDIDVVFREASEERSHHVEKSDMVDDILLIVPVENSVYFVVYFGGDSPVGWMDDTGIHVFDENALAYLEKSGAVIY